jgi:hypothetical protein
MKYRKEGDDLEYIGVDGGIVLIWMIEKYYVKT